MVKPKLPKPVRVDVAEMMQRASLIQAMQRTAAILKANIANGTDEPWYVLLPTKMFDRREELKGSFAAISQFPPGCVGFQFIDEWPTIGQRFTYDRETGTWDR